MPGTTNPDHGSGPRDTPATTGVPMPPHESLPDAASIRRGHEEDRYDLKSVLSVPLLVVLFFVLAFGTVTIVFMFVSQSEVNPKANPFAVQDNDAPLNSRLDRIHRGGIVDQPRLEPLRERTGDERAISRPATTTGNSPELHPEDIRPSPENTPELYKVGWINATKTVGRITIEEAMNLYLQKGFPTDKKGTQPPQSQHVPTASNAGRGMGPSQAQPPKLPVAEVGK